MYSLSQLLQKILMGALFVSASLISVYSFGYKPGEGLEKKAAHEVPGEIEGVGVFERLGEQVSLDNVFYDEAGAEVTLGQYYNADKPVIISIVYYECPSLCNYHLNGVNAVLKDLSLRPGKDYDLVAVTMNPKEGPLLTSDKKDAYVHEFGDPIAASGYHFLTGDEANIRKLAAEVGFKYKYQESSGEYAHASAAIITTPEGKISRYLHGIEFDANTFRLALLEGGQGKIGNIVDQILMFCFQFDPSRSKYTLYAWNIMRVGAVFMVILLLIVLVPLWMKEKKSETPA